MPPLAPTTPVIVGVGDIRNKSLQIEDAIEPAELMIQAIRSAVKDTSLPSDKQHKLLTQIDSISVVPPWTWSYRDLPGHLAQRLGASPSYTVLAEHGGDKPALLCDEAARAIAVGKSKVAIVTGGEALASLAACQKAGKIPPPGWTEPDPSVMPISAGDLSLFGENVGSLHSVGLPVHVYPMYENGYRAHRGQTFEQNMEESGKLYAAFDEVASRNPVSWNYSDPVKSDEDIRNISKSNRMICSPYPLLMNAFNGVNLAAACVLTSIEYAKELGIPEDNWIYPLGGAGTSESAFFWKRPCYYSSPAISMSLDAALYVSGLTKDDIECFDLYSCFPIVPKLACDHLGLPILNAPKPSTLLGGLTSFGGAGNNYSMHAITAMTRTLRAKQYRTGMILANGGYLTYQYALCLSSSPRKGNQVYPQSNPLPELVGDDLAPSFDDQVEGPATIETYTVQFHRKGTPEIGHIVGRIKGNGHRFIANHGDDSTLSQLVDAAMEPIGRSGAVKRAEDGRNLFFFTSDAKL